MIFEWSTLQSLVLSGGEKGSPSLEPCRAEPPGEFSAALAQSSSHQHSKFHSERLKGVGGGFFFLEREGFVLLA